MNSISNTTFDESGRFVVGGYSSLRPFSSFLPGIAGLMGIPLWVFYVIGEPHYTFYDSPAVVQPRSERYVLVDGEPRQLNAVVHDQEKTALIASRAESPNFMRTACGRGEIYARPCSLNLSALLGSSSPRSIHPEWALRWKRVDPADTMRSTVCPACSALRCRRPRRSTITPSGET